MTSAASAPSTSSRERLQSALPNGDVPVPLSEQRIRRVLARATAFFGLLFVVQTIPVMLRQIPELIAPWSYLLGVTILGCIAVVVVSAIIDPGRRVVFGIFAIVYLVAVLLWPFVVGEPDDFAADTPWIWYLVTVATTNAAIAFPLPVAVIYTVVTPLCYGIIRVTPAGGDVGLMRASLDTIYAILLSFAALIIYTTLRQAAAAVDAAQAGALTKYAGAVRQHATDVERVQVDAIVHDSVLTTLLSAAGADTLEQRQLASRMAKTALEHLESAADPVPEDVGDVSIDRLTRRIRSAASAFSAPFVIRASGIGDHGIPVHAAEALYSAAVQAMVNSMQHADRPGTPVRRRLTVTAPGEGCRIVVSDTGRGFDAAGIPQERLGIRVSIVERMQSVGGSAVIESEPGAGTTITLEWPSTAVPAILPDTTEDGAA